jgi:Ca2+-binding RTX toxin-like protein
VVIGESTLLKFTAISAQYVDNVMGADNALIGDIIRGNHLANRISAGRGNDRLTGGGGNDVYVFTSADNTGEDEITDFANEADRIDLTASGTTFAASAKASQAPGLATAAPDTLIALPNGKKIRLTDFWLANPDANGFLF